MEDDNNLKHIQDALNSLPEDFNILEEQIDVEMQLAYFEMAKELRDEHIDESLIEQAKVDLYNEQVSIKEKKRLLVKLAGVDDVESFRLIEAYRKEAEGKLKDWTVLALQESRMIIQSSLLGEQQVFISTGLGGKEQNIRYFVALIHSDPEGEFDETQQKLVGSEFQFFLSESNGELEEIHFEGRFAMAVFLFPLKQNLHSIFKSFIDECNQYGGFLNEDVIITNVKKLTVEELTEFISKDNHEEED
ncbi:MAG TPA: hypothetical protein VKA27_18355 [Sunxiuqinia sp.]|nr:hypothetical protein [Sunxiuqinia sp.]